MTWNRVVTIEDFWDRPRSGIAFRNYELVAYKCLWDEGLDDYSDRYGVMRINQSLLPLIEEKWEIWIRWSEAFQRGLVARETHPALPEDRDRYTFLVSTIGSQTEVKDASCERLCAEFRSVQLAGYDTEVRWSAPSVL